MLCACGVYTYVRVFECACVHLYVCMSSLMLLNLSGLLFHVVSPLHLFRAHIGVAVSIEGRMRQLDGGSAEIDTSRRGTTVRLSWAR